MRRAALCVLLAAVAAFAPAAAHADCNIHPGDHVVLYSGSDDPDVLLWDSRFRLRDYHAASFDVARELEKHADLITPGTRSIVEACVPDFVLSPLSDHPTDAVGVQIVAGPHHGERGWVIGTDVRHVKIP
ncbi:MAG: hypothetical protein JO199_06645 [Candidatus Eremiobacteraeota bacterium]|nr:hypothetical protein [Candidatus Eremiobacteraeota bacterium]